jgi:hypothetical protein
MAKRLSPARVFALKGHTVKIEGGEYFVTPTASRNGRVPTRACNTPRRLSPASSRKNSLNGMPSSPRSTVDLLEHPEQHQKDDHRDRVAEQPQQNGHESLLSEKPGVSSEGPTRSGVPLTVIERACRRAARPKWCGGRQQAMAQAVNVASASDNRSTFSGWAVRGAGAPQTPLFG